MRRRGGAMPGWIDRVAALRPVRTGLTLYRLPTLVGDALDPWLDLARQADAANIDQISVPDHVIFAEDARRNYPHGADKFPGPLDEAWHEPLTVLAGMAVCTRRIRLSMAVLIAPIRSGVLLAKTLATLDVLSNGRVDSVFGAGWQREEFDACNMPFDGRLGHLEEQVEACRLLWREAPASYAGRHIDFAEVYSRPFPVQRPGIPIWLGIAPSERSAPRIARLADGWVPAYPTPESVAAGMAVIRPQLLARGRDPDGFDVRAGLMPVNGDDGSVDLDATFAQVPAYIEAGATVIDATTALVSRREDIDEVVERLVEVKRRFGA